MADRTEELKELERRRGDWERDNALFLPMRQRLERGRRALEIWDGYAALRALRQTYERNRLEQTTLRENLATARTDLQSSEESFSLMEGKFRDGLAEQKRMGETVRKVQELDAQISRNQAEMEELRGKLAEADRELKEQSTKVERGQAGFEKLGLALRETRKYLQNNASDERLSTSLQGIQRCFELFTQATEKREALKTAYADAITKKQHAQSSLNDRMTLASDVAHKLSVAEKEHKRAQAELDSILKGKSLAEWLELCSQSARKLEALEDLSRKLEEEEELREKDQDLQERRRQAQRESRDLDIQDAAESGKIEELKSNVRKLEKRVSLLLRIQDLEAMRELLQDGVPCPLCGSVAHPYVSGTAPNEETTRDLLQETQRELDVLNGELARRRARSGLLTEELTSLSKEEETTRLALNTLSTEIGHTAPTLGLKLGTGMPPREELERVRQKERDTLQRARNTVENAEATAHDLKLATDDLERMRENQEELARYHQEALFQLKADTAETERLEAETKVQEESFNTIKREMISLLSPFGYRNVPDENPGSVVKALEERNSAWREQIRMKDELERELAAAQSSMGTLRKELDSKSRERDVLASRLKATKSEAEALRQQRILLFADKDTKAEKERMDREVEARRQQLDARREARAENAARLQKAMDALHDLETDMGTRREQIQRSEIVFGKQLLASGFKNEDDFLSANLSDEERRDLQARLAQLTQAGLELDAAEENAKARQVRLQEEGA